MSNSVHGIHHITCIAGDPRENLEFYTGPLGMRLVKKSVNQDVPDTYHLFYADGAGSPGTDLTFFPWPGMPPAKAGIGLAMEVHFSIPSGSMDYWMKRLQQKNIAIDELQTVFDEKTLPFRDPHGLRLALVETEEEVEFVPWDKSPVPVEHQIRRMHTVRLWQRRLNQTAALLTGYLGFEVAGSDSGWHRFIVDGGGPGKMVDLLELPDESRGQWGVGGIHHVAWRTRDSDEEMALRSNLLAGGFQPTQQIDRFWFKSVYFQEPGGVLFELATDGPGFDLDEDPAQLGEKLILPPWLESQRPEIEAALPEI